MNALFVFALPFALYGVGYGAYCLGRSLAQAVPALWTRFRQKKKGRCAAPFPVPFTRRFVPLGRR